LRLGGDESARLWFDGFSTFQKENFSGEFIDGLDHSLTELGMDDALAEMEFRQFHGETSAVFFGKAEDAITVTCQGKHASNQNHGKIPRSGHGTGACQDSGPP
jgi:hypothetical protein